jgi:iron uptake system component EfeO
MKSFARTPAIAAPLCALALLVSGCTKGSGSPSSGSSTGRTLKVGITDAGCEPAALTVPAGPTTFDVTNKGTSAVTEYEVKDGETIIGEKENLTPGLSGSFSIDLRPGDYSLECPGGTTPEGTLHVTGQGSAALGTGGGFVSHMSLGTQDIRSLAQAVDALAEPMSTIGATVVNSGA